MSELNPCPFCGSEARAANEEYVFCLGCSALFTGQNAITLWNTRAERTCSIIGFDDGVDEGIDGEWHQYSEPQYDLSCGHSSEGTEPPNYCPVCGARVVSE